MKKQACAARFDCVTSDIYTSFCLIYVFSKGLDGSRHVEREKIRPRITNELVIEKLATWIFAAIDQMK